jgi:hypothetical protein
MAAVDESEKSGISWNSPAGSHRKRLFESPKAMRPLLAFAFSHSSHPVWGRYGWLLPIAILVAWVCFFRK